MRLLALLACRDAMSFLPGFLTNVGSQVDGIVALDDGSSDGSAELLAGREEVLELLRNPRDRPSWDEPGNYRRLAEAALAHDPDWLVSIDADERMERRFRRRVERVVRRGAPLGLNAYTVRLRELWDTTDAYRCDGIWGRKLRARLFRADLPLRFDEQPLHAGKVPIDGRRLNGSLPPANVEIYHLGMLTPEQRAARRRRYETLDPASRWQPGIGYAYLTDTDGIRLRKIRARRMWRE